jgi:type I restriction-modification system DNA methylase subunit
VALPGQLFLNTQIPAAFGFLAKDKSKERSDRTGEVLFIDARKMGFMKSRVNRATCPKRTSRRLPRPSTCGVKTMDRLAGS